MRLCYQILRAYRVHKLGVGSGDHVSVDLAGNSIQTSDDFVHWRDLWNEIGEYTSRYYRDIAVKGQHSLRESLYWHDQRTSPLSIREEILREDARLAKDCLACIDILRQANPEVSFPPLLTETLSSFLPPARPAPVDNSEALRQVTVETGESDDLTSNFGSLMAMLSGALDREPLILSSVGDSQERVVPERPIASLSPATYRSRRVGFASTDDEPQGAPGEDTDAITEPIMPRVRKSSMKAAERRRSPEQAETEPWLPEIDPLEEEWVGALRLFPGPLEGPSTQALL